MTTAAKNAGLCMPCRHGYRDAIESSKQYYREQRESEGKDPFEQLWRSLVVKSVDDFEGMSTPEKHVLAVGSLSGEVYNGGFDQYFFNSSGSNYLLAVEGLLAIGAMRTLDLLRRAKQTIFRDLAVPTDTQARRRLLAQLEQRVDLSTSRDEDLTSLDTLFCDDPDDLSGRLQAYARDMRLIP